MGAFDVQFMSSGYASHGVWLGNGQNQCLDNWDGVVNTHSEHASQIATWPCAAYGDGAASLNQLWYAASAPTTASPPRPVPSFSDAPGADGRLRRVSRQRLTRARIDQV